MPIGLTLTNYTEMVGFQAWHGNSPHPFSFISAYKPPLVVKKHPPAVLELPATACTVQDVWPPSDVKFPNALTSWPIS